MSVSCPSCGAGITVPPERAANPKLKVKCRCATVFALSEAAPAPVPKPAAELGMAPGPLVSRAAGTRPAPVSARPATPRPVPATPRPVPATPRPGPRPSAGPRPLPARPAAAAPAAWAMCTSHPDARSRFVCPNCSLGYCEACGTMAGTACICPACDGLCVPAASFGAREQTADDRARPLLEDVGLIAGYPFRDPLAFVLLALFTWFFGLFKMMGGFAYILSEGVLIWYAFSALSKVAIGNTRDVMPDFSDVSDVVRPMRLGLAALAISYLPLILCIVFLSGLPDLLFADRGPDVAVAHASTADELPDQLADEALDPELAGGMDDEDERYAPSGPSPAAWVLLGFAILWKLAYTPVALTVGALSRSVVSTLNPVIGFSTIASMGVVYWQAAGIYTFIAVTQWGVSAVLGLLPVPIVPGLLRSFIDAYCWLAIGCTLGLAVYKKAPELGWD